MDNIKKIKEACIAANPEIMELKFGCELITGNTALGRVTFIEEKIDSKGTHWQVHCPNMDKDLARSFGSKVRSYGWTKPLEPDLPILGRPIRLADVLFMLDKNLPLGMWETPYDINDDDHEESSYVEQVVEVWDLAKDVLDHQSPETIEFLAGLI